MSASEPKPGHPYRILVPHVEWNERQVDWNEHQVKSNEFRGLCALAVMAKAPVPGRVKTRLCPPLTPSECADINACFLRDTVENLRLATLESPARMVISYTPVGEELAFAGILPEGTLLVPQRGDGFGERLLFTAEDLFACGFAAVCLIDSDSPTVPTSAFIEAARTLMAATRSGTDHVVLGQSQDGGYYLIGMNAPLPILFERISWSTEVVAQQTLARIAEAGLSHTLLEPWYDVDDADSLDTLREEFAGQGKTGYAAPHTRGYLAAHAAALDTRAAGARP